MQFCNAGNYKIVTVLLLQLSGIWSKYVWDHLKHVSIERSLAKYKLVNILGWISVHIGLNLLRKLTRNFLCKVRDVGQVGQVVSTGKQ